MAEQVSRRSIIYDILVDFKDGKKSITDAEKAVADLSTSMNGAASSVEKFSNNTLSSVAKLRQLKNQINNFKGSQVEFEKLTFAAAKLQDQIDRTNRRIRTLASSTRNIQALASGVQGLVGVFTAAQGAAALFGNENQNLQKAILRVQGALALLQGVQAAVATVTEQSAFKTIFLTNVQKAYNVVVGTSTGLMKGFRIALASTGVGLLVIGITELAKAFGFFNTEVKDATKNQKDFNDELERAGKLAVTNLNNSINKLKGTAGLAALSTAEINEQIGILKKSLEELPGTDLEFVINGDVVKSDIAETKQTILSQLDDLQRELERRAKTQAITLQPFQAGGSPSDTLETQEQEIRGIINRINADIERVNTAINFAESEEEIDSLRAELFGLNLELQKYLNGEEILKGTTQETQDSWKARSEVINETASAVGHYTGAIASSAGSLAGIAKEGSALQIALAEIQILASSAQAIANAIAGATASGAATGPAAAFTTPAFIATMVATVVSAFAQTYALLSKAKAAESNISGSGVGRTLRPAFAEGTPYLERGDNPKGTDTIPIYANEGERIIPTEENLKHWDIYEAIRNNSLDDFIKQNYISPELVIKGLEQGESDSALVDYSNRFYRQLIETKTGNQLHKAAIRELSSINRKLNRTIPERYA